MRPPPRHHAPERAARRASTLAAGVLLLALLAAQTLGLWHRTVHAPGSAPTAHAAHSAPAPWADHADPGHAGHDHAFGHAAGDEPQCRLFDQLMLADTALAIAVVLPAFEPVRAFVAAPVEEATRPTSAPYQARAPPAFG